MLELFHKKPGVYKISAAVIKKIYDLTKTFPKEEIFGLVSQLRRAAVSVTGNIAERAARKSNAEKKRLHESARSSLVEADTQIEICLLPAYLSKDKITELGKNIESVFRMPSKMINNLENPSH